MRQVLSDRRLNLVLRFIIGGLFAYAALEKVLHPAAFAMAVRGYKLIPFSRATIMARRSSAVISPFLRPSLRSSICFSAAKARASLSV